MIPTWCAMAIYYAITPNCGTQDNSNWIISALQSICALPVSPASTKSSYLIWACQEMRTDNLTWTPLCTQGIHVVAEKLQVICWKITPPSTPKKSEEQSKCFNQKTRKMHTIWHQQKMINRSSLWTTATKKNANLSQPTPDNIKSIILCIESIRTIRAHETNPSLSSPSLLDYRKERFFFVSKPKPSLIQKRTLHKCNGMNKTLQGAKKTSLGNTTKGCAPPKKKS